jgi:hypothetical protein
MTGCELTIEVPQDEVLRYLGYPRSRRPSARVEETLAGLWAPLLTLLRPAGMFRIVPGEALVAAGMPAPTEEVGIGLATVGSALEEEGVRQAEAGHALEALLIEALGSAAAEAATDALFARICAEARRRGRHLAPRVSPGYGAWPLEGQRALLALLDAAALGVRLTEGLLMVPRKSVSFAARLAAQPAAAQARRPCAACDRADCAYRVAPGDEG